MLLYCYILGCGIACLVYTGISSMDTVVVKPVELAARILLWPVALVGSLTRANAAHQMKAAKAAR